MRLITAALAFSAIFVVANPASSNAQEIAARNARGTAQIEALPGENGIRLTITTAGLEPQVFDGVGEALVPLRAGNRSGPILALDIDRDGNDEIFVRTSQGPRGILIVFRWDNDLNGYVPATFAEDTGGSKPYLIVHLSQPVSVNGNVVEANHDSNDAGRKRLRVFRYRWTGNGFTQTTDN